MIQRNWYLGKRIAEEEFKGKDRAEYGIEIIKSLSKSLTDIYGKGFNVRQLYYCESFYKTFPEILHTLCAKSYPLLSWSHYRILLQIKDAKARNWYETEGLSNSLPDWQTAYSWEPPKLNFSCLHNITPQFFCKSKVI